MTNIYPHLPLAKGKELNREHDNENQRLYPD